MECVYLCLGGNQGDVKNTFREAVKEINNLIGSVIIESKIYQTASWGDVSQPDYMNQVLRVSSSLPSYLILERCLSIENRFGRIRNKDNQWEGRTVDIDILLIGNQIIKTPNLSVPHPRMLQRNFVMIPLAEIAENVIHPIENKTIGDLVTFTNDNLSVKCITTT